MYIYANRTIFYVIFFFFKFHIYKDADGRKDRERAFSTRTAREKETSCLHEVV